MERALLQETWPARPGWDAFVVSILATCPGWPWIPAILAMMAPF